MFAVRSSVKFNASAQFVFCFSFANLHFVTSRDAPRVKFLLIDFSALGNGFTSGKFLNSFIAVGNFLPSSGMLTAFNNTSVVCLSARPDIA